MTTPTPRTPAPFHRVGHRKKSAHEYRKYEPVADRAWVAEVAAEYMALRSECEVPLTDISLDGIDIVDVGTITRFLKRATLPVRTYDNFDVIRSDFGETIAYMLLETFDGTDIGYKGVRDRETVQQPDRGIDVIGIEDAADSSGKVTMILGETKVSSENKSPPSVVDSAKESMRNQHRGHLKDRVVTARKIFNRTRRIKDPLLQQKLLLASYLLEIGELAKLRIITTCVLVRPKAVCTDKDCGSFEMKPEDYDPSDVRFLTVVIPDSVDDTVAEFYRLLTAAAA